MLAPKSIKERFFHARIFEVLAIALCAPLGFWAVRWRTWGC